MFLGVLGVGGKCVFLHLAHSRQGVAGNFKPTMLFFPGHARYRERVPYENGARPRRVCDGPTRRHKGLQGLRGLRTPGAGARAAEPCAHRRSCRSCAIDEETTAGAETRLGDGPASASDSSKIQIRIGAHAGNRQSEVSGMTWRGRIADTASVSGGE